MASWRCLTCRTVYAVGIPACPHCSSAKFEEDGVAKANAEGNATHYVAEGDPVPDDLPPGVRMVGPGAPAEPEPEVVDIPLPEVVPEPDDAAEDGSGPEPPGPSTPPESSGGSSDPDDDDGPADYGAYSIRILRELCRDRGLSPTGAKADLVGRLAEYDEEQP